jgi:Lysine-specific metallo-endopeptidase
MNFQTWKTLTKKRCYPRSTALTNLDTALKNYQKNPPTATIQQLSTAFNAWAGSKADYVNTIRNRKLDQQGLGPVERLARYIENEKGSHAARQPGVTHDVKTNTYLTDDGDYTKVHRKVVFDTMDNVKLAILAARETFQGGGFLSRPNFDALYQMWFGARDATRERAVRDKYDRLEQIVCNQPVNVHDDYAASDEFGHAYRGLNDQANIWLGEGFWDMSDDFTQRFASAMDARVGTLIHEFSHSILDAADERLGDGKVCNDAARDRQLATGFPDKAINNADNIANYALDALLIKTKKGRVP